MKGIKRSVYTCISVFLLLCFSVTIIPVDLFHSHAVAASSCQDSETKQACNHSFHVSTKSSYCWVCAIHYDKTFTNLSIVDKIDLSPTATLYLEKGVKTYFTKLIFSALRGPPAQ